MFSKDTTAKKTVRSTLSVYKKSEKQNRIQQKSIRNSWACVRSCIFPLCIFRFFLRSVSVCMSTNRAQRKGKKTQHINPHKKWRVYCCKLWIIYKGGFYWKHRLLDKLYDLQRQKTSKKRRKERNFFSYQRRECNNGVMKRQFVVLVKNSLKHWEEEKATREKYIFEFHPIQLLSMVGVSFSLAFSLILCAILLYIISVESLKFMIFFFENIFSLIHYDAERSIQFVCDTVNRTKEGTVIQYNTLLHEFFPRTNENVNCFARVFFLLLLWKIF